MKIALVTPWPPQPSGIADYAYQLAGGFAARGFEICVVTCAAAPRPLAGCSIRRSTGRAHIDVDHDALPVFQLGNNAEFHAFQLDLLIRLGGIVQLHDLVLHHVDRVQAAGRSDYWGDLRFWYGPRVVAIVKRLCELGAPPWVDSAAAAAIPMFEPYLQHADAVVVHSKSALEAIAERMPSLRAWHVPQCYPLAASNARAPSANQPLRAGVFGWIEPHKRIDLILDAVATLQARGLAIELDICGPIGASMHHIDESIAARSLDRVVHVHGLLEHAAFIAVLRDVDVCINLREPTMGETSAVVTQALQVGTPVIVSDAGWYAELPECVLKVPPGEGAGESLLGHLSRLAADRTELATLSSATRRYAASELNFDAMIGRYAGIVSELAAERARRSMLERALCADAALALSDLNLSERGSEGAIRAELLRTLASCL